MMRMKAICQKLYLTAFVVGCWLAVEGTALAKKVEAVKEERSEATFWVVPYMLMIFCIGLGMLVICRTSRRTDRAKPQQFEALKTND